MFQQQSFLSEMTGNASAQDETGLARRLDKGQHCGQAHQWLLGLLIFLNLIPIWISSYPPLQDYPDWLLQAQILRRLHDPRYDFAGYYKTHVIPVPNSAGVLLIYAISWFFSIEIAGKLTLSLYVLIFPLSALYLLRSVQQRASALEIIIILWVYNYFFYRGYIGYLLTASLLFLILGFVFRRWPRVDLPIVAVLMPGAIILFLGHLLAWGALMLAISFMILIWRRQLTLKKITLLALTLTPSLLLVLNFATSGIREFLLIPYPNLSIKIITYLYVLLLSFTNRPWGDLAPPLFVNAILTISLLGVVISALLASRRDLTHGQSLLRSPTIFAVGLGLLTIAAVMPLWLSGLTRPDERIFFPAMLILFSAIRWPKPDWRYDLILATLAMGLFALNAATFVQGGKELARIIDDLSLHVAPDKLPYIIRVPGSCEPMPGDDWLPVIEAAPRAPFYLTIRHGGHNRQIFDTSFIITQDEITEDKRIPWPLSLKSLKDTLPVLQQDVLPDYSNILLTGCPRYMQEIADLLADDFQPSPNQVAFNSPYLLLLQRTIPDQEG